MANVLLISANLTREPHPVYPLGMTLVAEAARQKGHTVVEADLLRTAAWSEQVPEAMRTFKPDVIGLSLRNIDNTDSSGPATYTDGLEELVRTLKTHEECPIVLGGAGYSLFPDALLERTGADYGIVGEGEESFCKLVDQLAAGTPPTHPIVRGESALSGNGSSAVPRDPELARFYLQEGGMLNVQTKRGCPHRCAYCTYPILEGQAYRFRPAEVVVDEMEMLISRYQADYIAIADSVFNDAQGRSLAIAEEIVRRQLRVSWMAYFRPARFSRDQVTLLKRAGLHSVEWGTDCTSDATLGGMQKDFTWSEVEHANRLFAEEGICNAHFVIVGGPGETEETVREGLANLDRLTECVVFAFCGIRILPGTSICRRAIEEEVISPADDLLKPAFYFSPGLTRRSLHETLVTAFSSRPDRIYPPGRDSERVRAFHRMGRRGPIWDLLLSRGSRKRRKG